MNDFTKMNETWQMCTMGVCEGGLASDWCAPCQECWLPSSSSPTGATGMQEAMQCFLVAEGTPCEVACDGAMGEKTCKGYCQAATSQCVVATKTTMLVLGISAAALGCLCLCGIALVVFCTMGGKRGIDEESDDYE